MGTTDRYGFFDSSAVMLVNLIVAVREKVETIAPRALR